MGTVRYTKQEAIRSTGMKMLARGDRVCDVARALDVAQSTVSTWKLRVETRGADDIKDHARSGRPRFLTDEQRELLVEYLEQGAQRYGFSTDAWTLARVAKLISLKFDVEYHPNYLGDLLRTLGFTPQKPNTVARQRDQKAVQRFREKQWPSIKKGEAKECCHTIY